jgi:hypothetical protein
MDEQSERRVALPRPEALQRFLARVAPEPGGNGALVDQAAAEVLVALERAGVGALLLKGRGLGVLLYGGDGSRRSFSDVDLLVEPAKLAVAKDALAGLGYTEADHGIDDIGGVVHAHPWIRAPARSGDEPPLDLHHRFPGSRRDPASAWEALLTRRTWIELGGRRAPVLDRAGQAMHLATHAAQHGPVFEKHISELELALALWPAEVWRSAARLAGEIAAAEPFAAGLRLSRHGTAVAARLGLARTDELDWAIRHRGERPPGTFHLQALAEAPSLRDRVGVVRRSLLPRREWIIYQHQWARRGRLSLLAAYGVHLATAPASAARARRYRRRVRRAGGRARSPWRLRRRPR